MTAIQQRALDPAGVPKEPLSLLEREALIVLGTIQNLDSRVQQQLPHELLLKIDAILMVASVRRLGA